MSNLPKVELNKNEMINENCEPTQKFYKKEFEAKRTKKYYAIYDKIAETFFTLSPEINDAVACRKLESIVNEKGNLVSQKPRDFAMFKICEMDEQTGEIYEDKHKIAEAADYVEARE